MTRRKVSVIDPNSGEKDEFSFDVGDTLEEMISRYGEIVVYKLAYEKAKTAAKNCARNLRLLKKTDSLQKMRQNFFPKRLSTRQILAMRVLLKKKACKTMMF